MAKPGQRLWTANNRIAGSDEYLRLGPWDTDIGVRAGLIRDRLNALEGPIREPDLLGIFADDSARLLERWQNLMLQTLASGFTSSTNAATWREIQRRVETWGARASVDSVGYRLVRAFRQEVMARILEPVLARCHAIDPAVDVRRARHEQPVWAIISQRPTHLLNPRFPSYEALFIDAVEAMLTNLQEQGVAVSATWFAFSTRSRWRCPLSPAGSIFLPRRCRATITCLAFRENAWAPPNG
jgi:penicillin amidase